MSSFITTIKDKIGLHARPASITVAEATKYESEITIESSGKKGNLKSIMNVMSLGIKQGDEIKVIAKGNDSEKAIEQIEKTMKENGLI